ncbi:MULTISPECIES: 2OG-Fe(II) oxygenase [Frankia]|nr:MULTISPECIES: 2OG-Fe(II) oxygenase [Frankia]KQC38056.1 proline hydroxylase [Frankia sp. ACN1ag]
MTAPQPVAGAEERVRAMDWAAIGAELDATGCALAGAVLTGTQCRDLVRLLEEPARFRSTVDMGRHRFGSGEYRYFDQPLPPPVRALRAAFYPFLLPVARRWAARLGRSAPWPDTLDAWLADCHRSGQCLPTPLLLRYRAGDWNALHRDLYGELVFPLQVVIGLDTPGADYTGGEFLLVEQRMRAQSRGTALTLRRGHALIFTTRDRPVPSARGWSASPMRHGVSTVRSGRRHALGLIFHDAA